jgi:hypothetical protein
MPEDAVMTSRVIVRWTMAALWLLAVPAWGVEYRLQVTHLDYLVFASYGDRFSASPHGEELMAGLEARLDHREFPTDAVIPGREIELLQDPAYGGSIPARQWVLPATRDQAWTTIVWEGDPGAPVAFVVKSYMAAWQEVWGIAANPQGVLRRLSLGGPGIFGPQTRQVPTVARPYLANAVDQGTFVSWLQHRAQAIDGMRLAVGRRYETFTSTDWVYMLITPPPQPHTFKVVIGWRDHSDRGDGKRFDRPRR